MEDPRKSKTKKALFQALGRLLKEKEFDRISVSDLVREAHITRKTFYNHYQDKIEMVQEYQRLLSEEIFSLQAAHGTFDTSYFVDLFTLLRQKDDLLSGLMSAHGSALMQDIMKGSMAKYCLQRLSPQAEDPLFLQYQSVMLANAIFGVVQYWLADGRKTPPEELARILSRLRSVNVRF